MRPLPNRSTAASRIGTEVHKMIEERIRGVSAFAEETELDDPGKVSPPGHIGETLR